MTMTAEDHRLLVEQVRELARTREHRLSARQLAALESQTTASVLAMRTYLDGRPPRSGAQVTQISADIHRATQAAISASTGDPAVRTGPISSYAKAGGHPASDRPGRRPGPKVTEPGIYYYSDRIYKVILSQYSGHLQARRLDPQTRKYSYAEGMMGVLRAADKMTAEQSVEYEALYDYAACTDCGLPLENDLSRRRRVGPVCWDKNGHTDNEIED
jgi:Family of unknown function (DUF6011)